MYSQEELQAYAYEEDTSTPDRPENVKPVTWGHHKVFRAWQLSLLWRIKTRMKEWTYPTGQSESVQR